MARTTEREIWNDLLFSMMVFKSCCKIPVQIATIKIKELFKQKLLNNERNLNN